MTKNVTATTTWELQIIDRTEQKTILNYDQITAMPETTVEAELYCYGDLVTSGHWTGVKISDLLKQVGADLNAQSIIFTANDGYTINISMETATRPDVILAYEKDESQLAETYRLVIPMANGNMWIAMINFMTLSDGGADNLVSAVTGPIINMNENQFTQNSNQLSQNTQQPTPKPPAPTIPPSPTSTPIVTISPASTVNPSNQQTATQPIPQYVLYSSIVVILAVIILVSLLMIRNNRTKANF